MAPDDQEQEDQLSERIARLAEIFAGDDGPLQGAKLKDRLDQLRAAAFAEYELALSGSRFPSTIKELRELRLMLLYEHLPVGLPTDEQIGELFQMTRTQVGTLVAGTRARFGPEIEARVKREATAALEAASKVNENTVRVLAAESLARYLEDLIARTNAPAMEKRKDASRSYDVGRDTVEGLCRQLGVKAAETVKAIKWK